MNNNQTWIDADDLLPERHHPVIGYSEADGGSQPTYHDGYRWLDPFMIEIAVSHWMEYPEAPEGY